MSLAWLYLAGVPQVYFQFGHLINTAGPDAANYLCKVADVVWPPSSGKDIWLRGQLAKWMVTAGYVSGGAQTLRAILAVGPDSPTAFRIDMGIAGGRGSKVLWTDRCIADSQMLAASSGLPRRCTALRAGRIVAVG